jgi:hypothetical protein
MRTAAGGFAVEPDPLSDLGGVVAGWEVEGSVVVGFCDSGD